MKRLSFLAAAAAFAISAQATPSFVNGLVIAATTGDTFGNSVNDGRLGMFSDLYYDTNRNEWWGLSDRGPGGGTISYETRIQRFTIDVNPSTGAIANFQIRQTLKFTGPAGNYNGLAPSPNNVLGRALDPEGVVVNPLNGNLLISDEYGPSLYEFNRSGQFVRSFVTPANLIPRSASGVPNFADDTGNTQGKRTNRGFEGLAISPDGQFAYAMLQSAMLDEGAGNGTYNRIVKFSTANGQAVAQYAYQMEGSSQGRGISSLVALDDHRFMVLERNNRGVGVSSDLATPYNKKVYVIDIAGATDVSSTVITGGVLPGGVTLVTKLDSDGNAANGRTALIDLAADTLPALGGKSPEKWEGLTVGPRLADGSYLLLAGTDNDYSVTQNGSSVQFDVFYNPSTGTRLQCDLGGTTNCVEILADGTVGTTNIGNLPAGYALIPGVLHAYKATLTDLGGYMAPVPEPAAWALMLSGLIGLAYIKRRRD